MGHIVSHCNTNNEHKVNYSRLLTGKLLISMKMTQKIANNIALEDENAGPNSGIHDDD